METTCDSTEEGCQSRTFDIAIVGGGCSGVLVAVQLLRRRFPGRIAIVEMHGTLGRGLAYSTPFEQHLLNVPAKGMSAFPDQPSHFVDWLRSRKWPGAAPDLFAPRCVYGEYLADLLQIELRNARPEALQRIEAEVTDIQPAAGGLHLSLASGSVLKTRRAVLALGNPASSPPVTGTGSESGGLCHASPWIGAALRAPVPGERILLIGTGLTAVDAALALLGQTRDCEIHALSRRGLLPQVHDLRRSPADPPIFEQPGDLRAMFRDLRSRIALLRDSDGCWRSAVDGLRPVSNRLWQQLPVADQRRFMRHLRTHWETHRHRMAPEVRRQVNEYMDEGKLRVIPGRLRKVERKGDVVEVTVSGRGGSECVSEVHRVINCSGIHEDYSKASRPLIAALIRRGLASANNLAIGFRTDQHGALIASSGVSSHMLFTLGPPRRGELFETTAVPEIRVQAETLAAHLWGRPIRLPKPSEPP
jgi:uncharacterized NAD(P)/FAD-binding protein YdhS